MPISELDRQHMDRAIALAKRGQGLVEPNPMVGCVIAERERVISEGWHQRFGGAHAEVLALQAVPSGVSLAAATMYVSLEPCCHDGKTPACTQSILVSGISRVVVAMEDPFPEVRGGGLSKLREAEIEVELGCAASSAAELNRPYLKRLQTGLPWVLAKWAMTLDGKIATRTGDSQWISDKPSRELVHKLRGRMDAIVVGRRTAQRDNPSLTARPPGPRVATRVVVDRSASLPTDSKLAQTTHEAPVLVATSAIDTASAAAQDRVAALHRAGCEVICLSGESANARLCGLLQELGRREFTNVLVEGGGQLLGSLLDQRLIDEVHVFVAPLLLGGASAITPMEGTGAETIAKALRLADLAEKRVGRDLYLTGRLV